MQDKCLYFLDKIQTTDFPLVPQLLSDKAQTRACVSPWPVENSFHHTTSLKICQVKEYNTSVFVLFCFFKGRIECGREGCAGQGTAIGENRGKWNNNKFFL